jgi:hypothetical protein
VLETPDWPWNGNGQASPSFGTGGVDFSADALGDDPLYLYALGSGDVELEVFTSYNYATGIFAGIQSRVPAGFTLGFPDAGGAQFDNGTAQGSAVFFPSTQICQFQTVAGCIMADNPVLTGFHYFEYYTNLLTFSSNSAGIGIARAGATMNELFAGEQNASDIYGGPVTWGGFLGNSWKMNGRLFGDIDAITWGSSQGFVPQGSIVGVAMAITQEQGYVPTIIQPVKLPGVPCCPIKMPANKNRRWRI